MDAKPQRLPRVLPIIPSVGDENASSNQLAHQRQKSIGGTVNGSTAGALSVAAKRTAFGDVSNTAHALVDPTSKEPAKTRVSTFAPREKPTTTDEEIGHQGGEAFLRPPQRSFAPPIAPLQINSVRIGPKVPALMDPLRPETIAKPAPAKKTTFVFSDEGENKAKPQSETSVKSGNSAATMENQAKNQVKNPRHFKSQPQLRTEQQPDLRRTQSRHFGNNTGLLIDFDEDVVEPTYHDAVESLGGLSILMTDQLQVNSAPSAVQEPDIGQPVNASTPSDQVNASSQSDQVNASSQSDHLLANDALGEGIDDQDKRSLMVEPDENSDEDDADLYDDQAYTTAHSIRSLGDNTTGGVTTLLVPKVTDKVLKELEVAKAIVAATRTEEDISEEEWDTSMVAEYGEEIFEYMRNLENNANLTPNPHYMDIQGDLSWSMRSILMEWLIQVHNRFGLLPETLFLAVNCIDRFLSVKIVSLSKLQLVGATAIFVAAKYEEINCPSVQEIVYMVDGSFTIDEILKAERFMLSMLDFELGWPGPMSFLRRISKADDYDIDTRTLAKYFMEVTIMDERFVGSRPSFIAAGAHCLARLMLRKGHWTAAHTHYSGYTLAQIKPLVCLIFECCVDPVVHHWAVYDKYQTSRFQHVSVFVRDQISKRFTLTFQPNLADSPERSLLEEFKESMQYVVTTDHRCLLAA